MLQGVASPTLYWPADEVGSQTPRWLQPGDLSLVDYIICHILSICFGRNPPRSCLVRHVLRSFWIRSSGNLLEGLQEVVWAAN
jgi:hypothetical protein